MVCDRNSLSQQLGVPFLGHELPATLYAVWRVTHRVCAILATPNQTDHPIPATHVYHRTYLLDDCTMVAFHIRQLQRPGPVVAGARSEERRVGKEGSARWLQ